MTKHEMETIIKQAGWTPHQRQRYRTLYLYASRREGKAVKEVYLTRLDKAQAMSPEELSDLLRKKTSRLNP